MVDAKTLHWVFSVPVGIIISIFGLVGNALSIYVWNKMVKKQNAGNKSTGIYLLTLAVVDSGLLLFFLFHDSLPSLVASVRATESFCNFDSYIGFPFFFFFVVASIWLVVGVTCNRFIMVLFPIKSKKWCSKNRAYFGIISILICSFLINIPHFLNFRPQEVNGTYIMAETQYAKSGGAQRYEFWVHCMFLVLAPWALVAFFNGGIIYSLMKRARKIKQTFGKSKNKERDVKDSQMTIMLLTITFSFLFLLAWQCITQCFFMLGFGKGSGKWDIVNKSFAMAKLGVVINSSLNFILYCCTGTAFRKELKLLFRRSRRNIYVSSVSSGSGGTKLTDSTMAESKH